MSTQNTANVRRTDQNDTDPRWGRVNFGSHPRKPALPIARIGGSLVAAALALGFTLLIPQHPTLLQNLLNFWVPALPASIATFWLGIVDRSTCQTWWPTRNALSSKHGPLTR